MTLLLVMLIIGICGIWGKALVTFHHKKAWILGAIIYTFISIPPLISYFGKVI